MRRLAIQEHQRIWRGQAREGGVGLEEHLFDRLRAFDQRRQANNDRALEWLDGFARATQWVGVLQIPGLQLEILPKIDEIPEEEELPSNEPQPQQREARSNLLYMLSLAGGLPVKQRGVAHLAAQDAPISEVLAAIFAERLRQELLVGPACTYVSHEEELRRFKGKLVISKHIIKSASLKDRFYCQYDQFSENNPLNRIFKTSCLFLLKNISLSATQASLHWCLSFLEGVDEVESQKTDFEKIVLNRQQDRFKDILRFCQLLLSGRSPNTQAGEAQSFSLLFDMNQVFERFVASFLHLYVVPNIKDCQIWPQAKHKKCYLMESEGRGVLALAPDLLIEAGERRFVMDTKWKRLRFQQKTKGNISEADLYQLYAYVHRYGCSAGALLYPYARGFEERHFDVLDDHEKHSKRFLVRAANLHRDLQRQEEREVLAQELEKIVREGLGL